MCDLWRTKDHRYWTTVLEYAWENLRTRTKLLASGSGAVDELRGTVDELRGAVNALFKEELNAYVSAWTGDLLDYELLRPYERRLPVRCPGHIADQLLVAPNSSVARDFWTKMEYRLRC